MSNRLGDLDLSRASPEQQTFYHEINNYVEKIGLSSTISTKSQTGALMGPFGVIVHTPVLGRIYLQMADALAVNSSLSGPVKEIVTLTVGSRTKAAYQLYAHRILGSRAGVSEQQRRVIERGECPDGLSEEQQVAWEVASASGRPGTLDGEIWERGVKVLGKEGMAVLVHHVAFYNYVGFVLNGFDVKAPE